MDLLAAARGAMICFWPDLVELRPSLFSLALQVRVISTADVSCVELATFLLARQFAFVASKLIRPGCYEQSATNHRRKDLGYLKKQLTNGQHSTKS